LKDGLVLQKPALDEPLVWRIMNLPSHELDLQERLKNKAILNQSFTTVRR
jgi:hypothetical protein